MKNNLSIGFIGTRGIPNEYGGYEAAVQELAPRLAERGHRVVVYCSLSQKSRWDEWKGVQLVYNKDPENRIGSAGQFIYDLWSNLSARKHHHDVIFHMGYTSDSVWHKIWDARAAHITNMDGLEWKRTKYSKQARKFLGWAEKLAAKNSHALIADNKGIEDYLKEKYKTPVLQISYGVEIPQEFDEIGLEQYQLQKHQYDLVIARMVPENNIETIIQAKIDSSDTIPLVLFGNRTPFRDELMSTYQEERIVFEDGNFNKNILDGLRHFARYYIHGHSVGGTNPSLLEAMATQSRIIAHDNVFNRHVLLKNGKYFTNKTQLSSIFDCQDIVITPEQVKDNLQLLFEHYNWDQICDLYERAALQYA
jgi:glycosyltransferase involved in cell wall biosynthesis